MNIPKGLILRALVRSGTCPEEEIDDVRARLVKDVTTQKRFLKVWREKKGARFPRLRALIHWMMAHQAEIRAALGIILMFADEEPKDGKKLRKEETKETKAEAEVVLPPSVNLGIDPENDTPPVVDDGIIVEAETTDFGFTEIERPGTTPGTDEPVDYDLGIKDED